MVGVVGDEVVDEGEERKQWGEADFHAQNGTPSGPGEEEPVCMIASLKEPWEKPRRSAGCAVSGQ